MQRVANYSVMQACKVQCDAGLLSPGQCRLVKARAMQASKVQCNAERVVKYSAIQACKI